MHNSACDYLRTKKDTLSVLCMCVRRYAHGRLGMVLTLESFEVLVNTLVEQLPLFTLSFAPGS